MTPCKECAREEGGSGRVARSREVDPAHFASEGTEFDGLTVGVLTSIGRTLDAFFVEIIAHWKGRGIRVKTAAGDPSAAFADQEVITGLTRNPSPRNVAALVALRRWVREERIDVVLANTATASLVVRAAGVDAPVIYFCHGLHWNGGEPRHLPFRTLERAVLSRTDGVVVINEADEHWFATRAPRIPRARLRLGVGLDTERFTRLPYARWDGGGCLHLLWCGELTKRKNPIGALRLALVLRDRGVNFRLEILGDGILAKDPTFRALAAQLQDAVVLHGHADPVPVLKQAHVLVQTALWEGLPRVALEAVAMGRPTAGFDVKGVADVPGAYLAPEGDVEKLADAVLCAASEGPRDLPDPELLSVNAVADELLTFVRKTHAGAVKSAGARKSSRR